MNFRKLAEITRDDSTCVAFLQELGLLRYTWECRNNCSDAKVRLYKREGHGWIFRCSQCGQTRNLKAGTWFENTNLQFQQTIDFIYFWARGCSRDVCREESRISSMSTSTDWARYCREICELALLSLNEGQIGGEGVVVEIDESKFSKRKYNCGRSLKDGWVFGGIERESRKSFFVLVNDRTEETLLSIIKERIAIGSIINCDSFRSYTNVEKHGYSVYRVNHSKNFVDAESGAHTQNIESAWGVLKRFLRVVGRNFGEHVEEYIIEATYRQRYGLDVFNQLLKDAARFFPPK